MYASTTDNRLRDVLPTDKCISDAESIEISWEIRLQQLEVLPLSTDIMPEPPPLGWVKRWHYSVRTEYRNKVVIAEAEHKS